MNRTFETHRRGRVITTFQDQYEQERTVIRGTNGKLHIAKLGVTPIEKITATLAPLIGQNIRRVRQGKKMTMKELGEKSGLTHYNAKCRIHEIEKGWRYPIKMGTLYAIATALNVEANSLLPTNRDVLKSANVSISASPILKILDEAEL